VKIKENKNRVILIGIVTPYQKSNVVSEHLEELKQLVSTLKYEIVDSIIIYRNDIVPATFIGKGKIEEVKDIVSSLKIDEVIFDDDISPTQMRNLQKMLNVDISDRTGIILNIFADHAKTKEAKTQIELASLQYLLPRLTRRWTHLGRQIGGIGFRGGAGETQIEADRRLIRRRIAKIKNELDKIEKERNVQKSGRDNFFRAALVGYTNSGKSTLMNAFTGSNILVENKLFATLDTTVRACNLDKYHTVLLSDTIGFIRKLPHNLVASFRSTLGEVENSDLIIKVADISSMQCIDQLKTVDEVLLQLGVDNKPSIVVFNKIDKMDRRIFAEVKRKFPNAIYLSALHKLRLDDLKEAILRELRREEVHLELRFDVNNIEDLVLVRNYANIISEKYIDGIVNTELIAYKRVWSWLEKKLKPQAKVEEFV
jgi:GTP-binding protein HflX